MRTHIRVPKVALRTLFIVTDPSFSVRCTPRAEGPSVSLTWDFELQVDLTGMTKRTTSPGTVSGPAHKDRCSRQALAQLCAGHRQIDEGLCQPAGATICVPVKVTCWGYLSEHEV